MGRFVGLISLKIKFLLKKSLYLLFAQLQINKIIIYLRFVASYFVEHVETRLITISEFIDSRFLHFTALKKDHILSAYQKVSGSSIMDLYNDEIKTNSFNSFVKIMAAISVSIRNFDEKS